MFPCTVVFLMAKGRNARKEVLQRIENLKLQGGKIRARAYLRVSMARGEKLKNMVSDEMQFQAAKRYCEYHGFELDEEASWKHADLDESAFDRAWTDRPGIMQHFRDAKKGEFQVLVFFKISRMARDAYEGLDMIKAFEAEGVVFHFVEENLDGGSPQGRMMRTFMLAFAEMQSEDLSAFVKGAARQRALDGKFHGGSPPSWIRRVDKNVFEVVEPVADVFRRMVALRIDGKSYLRIAEILNAEGKFTVNGATWCTTKVHRYLTDSWLETMIGFAFFGRNKLDGIPVKLFPPILSEDEYQRIKTVQRLYAENPLTNHLGIGWQGRKGKKTPVYSNSPHLLSRVIRCPICGAAKIGSTRTKSKLREGRDGEGRFYRCMRYSELRQAHQGTPMTVDAVRAEDAVLRVLKHCCGDPLPLLLPKPAVVEPLDVSPMLARVDRKIARLLEMVDAERIREVDFDRLYAQATAERSRLESSARAVGTTDAQESEKAELCALKLFLLGHLQSIVGPVFLEEELSDRKGRAHRDSEVCRTSGYRVTPRQYLVVTLKEGVVQGTCTFLAPLYAKQYAGPRVVIPIDGNFRVDGVKFSFGGIEY